MKKILLAAVVMVLGSSVQAQTLLGIKTECGKKCEGSFQIRNDGLKPLMFSIDTTSVHFSKEEQRPIRDGLEEGVDAKLSQSSGRLSPKETRQVNFKVRCKQMPCVVAFSTGMVVGKNAEGVAVRLVLSHYVYLDSQGKGARLRILQAAGVVPPEDRKQ